MKYTLLFLSLCLAPSLFAQDFILLENDPENDPTLNGVADLRSVSYAIDEAADSLWFEIALHTEIPGDLGIVFGIDTDLVPDNGLMWDFPSNMDLAPEVVFTINRNFIAPDQLYGFSNIMLEQQARFGENDSTIIVNMSLSTLDEDGRFNLVLGSSTFDCDANNRFIFDNLPETGFLTVDITSSVQEVTGSVRARAFPNPVIDILYVEKLAGKKIDSYWVFNSAGQRVACPGSVTPAFLEIHSAGLVPGLYRVQVLYSDGISAATTFVKQ
ncbi:MAG: T9SS type A sorting domain-containing protein [Bacteroidota bacterium]